MRLPPAGCERHRAVILRAALRGIADGGGGLHQHQVVLAKALPQIDTAALHAEGLGHGKGHRPSCCVGRAASPPRTALRQQAIQQVRRALCRIKIICRADV